MDQAEFTKETQALANQLHAIVVEQPLPVTMAALSLVTAYSILTRFPGDPQDGFDRFSAGLASALSHGLTPTPVPPAEQVLTGELPN